MSHKMSTFSFVTTVSVIITNAIIATTLFSIKKPMMKDDPKRVIFHDDGSWELADGTYKSVNNNKNST